MGAHMVKKMKEQRKGLLAVSLGTSCKDAEKKSINSIEHCFQEAFPERKIYRAFSSERIRSIIKERQGFDYPNIGMAMEEMLREKVTHVIVQPTYIWKGTEYEKMRKEAEKYKGEFHELKMGSPLLSSIKDMHNVIPILMEEFKDIPSKEALVFVGHGNGLKKDNAYAAFDSSLKEAGYRNAWITVLKGEPCFHRILNKIKTLQVQIVHLLPLMTVAGVHVFRDIEGGDGSLCTLLTKEGFQVQCHKKGMGEYQEIREQFVSRAKAAEIMETGSEGK